MDRSLYGHDYKPRSNAGRNSLFGATLAIVLGIFVWVTYNPGTYRMLSGVTLEAKNTPPVVETPRIDLTTRSAAREPMEKTRDRP
jgi:hypothetical protein